MERYKYQVMDVCRDLHCICTGTMDGYQTTKIEELAQWLRFRVATWTPCRSKWEEMLRELARETISDTEKFLRSMRREMRCPCGQKWQR